MAYQPTKFNSAEQAVEELTSGIVDVYFIKKTTGQPRHMHCTLDEKYIPQGNDNTLDSIIAKSLQPGAESFPIVVWDLLVAGWRSFYLHSVTLYTVSSFDDTREMMERMIEEADSLESGEISPETRTMLTEEFTKKMTEKINMAIENAPQQLIEFSESKIKAWAATIFTSLWNNRNLKRSFRK